MLYLCWRPSHLRDSKWIGLHGHLLTSSIENAGGTNSWWVVNKISCKMVHIFDIGLDVQLGWRVFMVWWFSACISWPLTISGSCHRRPLLQRNQLGSKLRLPQRRLLGKHQSPARRNDMQARRIFMFHLWKFWNMKIEGRHGGFLLLIGISLPVGLWWLWRSPVWGSLRRNSHVSPRVTNKWY